jgi:hypothetical protein
MQLRVDGRKLKVEKRRPSIFDLQLSAAHPRPDDPLSGEMVPEVQGRVRGL